uniref:Uncharacterized protein n=1 Tax=Octopus bimaculoides TaxID=37653 RepID=A0A0L8HQH9_OCTBM
MKKGLSFRSYIPRISWDRSIILLLLTAAIFSFVAGSIISIWNNPQQYCQTIYQVPFREFSINIA